MTITRNSLVSELRSLDLNLLVTLKVLLDEQHVSRAAVVAGLTQSGMSRSFQRLRTMFDDQLLVKVEHGYELTSRAQELNAALGKVLANIQNLMVPSSFDPLKAEGEFRIASFDYELLVLMPTLISELRILAPGITINAINLRSIDFDPLIRGDVHLAFSAFDKAPPYLLRKRIFIEDKVCLISAKHHLDDEVLTTETLNNFKHVWVNIDGPDPGEIDATLAKHHLSRNMTVMVPSFLLAARIAAKTNLMTILPRRIAQHFLDSGQLKIVKLPFNFPEFSIFQYWHPRNNNNPQQQWLRQLVYDVAKTLPRD